MKNAETLLVAICEDTPEHMEQLSLLIKKSGIPAEVSRFENAGDFLQNFHAGKYDVIFMDIYFSNESAGIAAARQIREKDMFVTIAFTTTSLDHTLESYRLKAAMYLEKPLKEADIKETLELALIKRRSRAVINISLEGGKKADIPLDSIMFFEQKGNEIEVVTTTSGILRTSRSVKLGDMETQLPSPPFLRCHRSFIVNLDHVLGIDKDTYSFTLRNGGRADINQRKRLKEFEDALQLWIVEKAGREN